MKTFFKFVVVYISFFSFFCFSNTEDSYVFFQTAGEWGYGEVYVDDEYKGRIFNGYAFLTLNSGTHTLTMLKQYGYQGSYNYIKPNIRFVTEKNKLTSLGTIAILKSDYGKNTVFFLKNNESALKYTKLYFPSKYATISSYPILHPTLRYQNNILDEIRQKYLLEYHKNINNEEKFISSALGLLASLDSGKSTIIDTGILDPLKQLAHLSNHLKPVFITSLSELYLLDTKFERISIDESNPPKHGAQVNEWIFTIGDTGNLSYSNNLGGTWLKKETKISKNKYVQTISALTNKEFLFGPVTSSDYDNDYAKLVGYLVDHTTAEAKEINWSKHVTTDSVFHRVNNTLFMDPVTLGNKAFLFMYIDEKNKWKEVRLPNRRCKIHLNDDEILLNCSQGSSYSSSDGDNWKEVKK